MKFNSRVKEFDEDLYYYRQGTFELHREIGPAIQYSCGKRRYFLMDKEYSYEEWLAVKDCPLLW